MSIEDPFEFDHDLGRPIGHPQFQIIRREFHRAFQMLQSTGDIFLVCKRKRSQY